jgi:hypothetical protein
MVDRFGLDNNQDGIIDYDYSHQYIHPSSGYSVNFDGCMSRGNVSPIVSYTWRIEGNGISYELFENSCRMSHPLNLPEGNYTVTLIVRTQNGMADLTTRTVVVKNLLIVSIGDSYASGEGNPDQPQRFDFTGLFVEKGPEWEDKNCHRSANAGPAQAALEIERSDPHTSVTFLSYACSGATITQGLVGWYDGVESASSPAPHEFQQFILQTSTALHPTDQTFDFAAADWNNDRRTDLIAIKKSNTGTGSTEVHILT